MLNPSDLTNLINIENLSISARTRSLKLTKQERESNLKLYHEYAEKVVQEYYGGPFKIEAGFKEVKIWSPKTRDLVVIDKYRKYSNLEDFLGYLNRCDVSISTAIREFYRYGIHDNHIGRNIFYTRLLGMPPTWFHNKFRTSTYQAFVGWLPPDLVSKVFVKNNSINTGLINDMYMHDTLEIVLEAYRDDLINLIPLILRFKKNPKQLKEYFGNKAWKVLCKNSVDRNKGFVCFFNTTNISDSDKLDVSLKEIVKEIADAPTVLLKSNSHFVSYSQMLYAGKHMRGKWSKLTNLANASEELRDLQEYRDTVRMIARDENYEYDTVLETLNWSIRRVKEEHNKIAKAKLLEKYSPEIFEWLKDFSIKTFTSDGYTSELLMSPSEIALEGSIMGHCVGLYADSVERKNYLIFSVKDSKGAKYSTIGINVYYNSLTISDEPGHFERRFSFNLNQHYKAYNQIVNDPNANAHCTNLINALNKAYE